MTMPERIWVDEEGEYWRDHGPSTYYPETEYVRADLSAKERRMNPMDDPKLRISQQVAAIKAWERSQMNFDPVEIERQRAMPERIWAGTGPLEGEWYFQDGVLYGSTAYVRADLYEKALARIEELRLEAEGFAYADE